MIKSNIMSYNKKIKVFYNENMAVKNNVGYSRSPEKPALLIKFLSEKELLDKYFEIESTFPPFEREDFLIAHSEKYVDAFFSNKSPLCNSNGLAWSKEFAKSVTYTNSSLYHAIKSAIQNSKQVTFSPTSGFHHAMPAGGRSFCTFSGQVIASVKIYREFGKRAAWLDLDQHFGNSIGDSMDFVKDLKVAIPTGFNVNPEGDSERYIKNLETSLDMLRNAILNNEIDYVVWAHGADSHEQDDLGGKVNTEQFIRCSKIFFNWVKDINIRIGKPLPIIITLFGGYREDDFNSVLALHAADLVECLIILMGNNIDYQYEIKEKS